MFFQSYHPAFTQAGFDLTTHSCSLLGGRPLATKKRGTDPRFLFLNYIIVFGEPLWLSGKVMEKNYIIVDKVDLNFIIFSSCHCLEH
jgi:hypothetical protein